MQDESVSQIPAQLMRLRGSRQVSQQELARRSDVSRMTINRIENNQNLDGVTLGTLCKISRALDVRVRDLMGHEDSLDESVIKELLRSFTHSYANHCGRDSFTYAHAMNRELVSFDNTYQSVLGYSWRDLIGKEVDDLVTPASGALSFEMRARKLEGEFITTYRVEFLTRGRVLLPAEVTTQLIYYQGTPIGIQGIARRLT